MSMVAKYIVDNHLNHKTYNVLTSQVISIILRKTQHNFKFVTATTSL